MPIGYDFQDVLQKHGVPLPRPSCDVRVKGHEDQQLDTRWSHLHGGKIDSLKRS